MMDDCFGSGYIKCLIELKRQSNLGNDVLKNQKVFILLHQFFENTK